MTFCFIQVGLCESCLYCVIIFCYRITILSKKDLPMHIKIPRTPNLINQIKNLFEPKLIMTKPLES